ncbi:hypothetical protein [Nocardia sp. NPDC058633]|uniref:hypothetical protein n=1 Tax=Nocardia sp. NPDC058633 TaxID=3346568 RepID=UPI003655C1A6
MLVDPDRLRLLSKSMDTIAVVAEGLSIADSLVSFSASAESGNPESLVSEVLGSGLSVCEDVWSGFGSRCRQVSAASRGGASDFEVTDAEFSDALRAVAGAL